MHPFAERGWGAGCADREFAEDGAVEGAKLEGC